MSKKDEPPAFITKLLAMLSDPEIQNLISWGPTGNTFIVHDSTTLAAEVLPKYYKHHNFTSLVRQLNMYGFHKVVGVEQGGLESQSDHEWEFIHPSFKKDQPALLKNVRRKEGGSGRKPKVDMSGVMKDLHALKGQHGLIESKFQDMAMQNQQLWNEVTHLRQQHQEHSWKLQNILSFMARLVQPEVPATGGKRRRLALEMPNIQEVTTDPAQHSTERIPPPNHTLVHLDSTDAKAPEVMGTEINNLGSKIEEARRHLEDGGMNPGVLAGILGTPPPAPDEDMLPAFDTAEPVSTAAATAAAPEQAATGSKKRKVPEAFDLPLPDASGPMQLYSPLAHFLDNPFDYPPPVSQAD